MAHITRSRIGILSFKYNNRVVPRNFVPLKYKRLCFHTSWVLDVKGKELRMPALSPTMETGTIIKWLKKEGDKIQPGDAVADIQTDKAVVTMEFDDESVLAKILVSEGTKDIKIGTLIALTVEADEDWKSVDTPQTSVEFAPAASAPSSTSAPSSASSGEAAPPSGQQNIKMPALSPTMTVGTIIKWLKKEGDQIEAGDALAEIQTDKAVMTFELEDEVVLAKILKPDGSQVEVGELIAITVEKGMDWTKVVIPSVTKPVGASTSPTAPLESSLIPPSLDAKSPSPPPPPSGQVYGLAVKRLLEEYGLSSGSVKGTGRTNRLLKSDVLAYILANNLQKVPIKSGEVSTISKPTKAHSPSPSTVLPSRPSPYEDIPIPNIRAVIAKRLGESKTNIPHSYAYIDINIDKLIEIRSKLKTDNINVSINDFITKAAGHALLECPVVNSLYQKDQIIRVQNVDISIAVAAPTGLITPIVFNVSSKSLIDISKNIKELAEKARAGTLKPHEFQGGSFTISNLGMFGITQFSAIINPPQTAILAVGSGREILEPSLVAKTMMSATLSYDRRVIDEDEAAEFLAVLRAMLEDPTFLTVGRIQALRYMRD